MIKQENNNYYEFIVTDKENEIKVKYSGILPDLFREGQGAVIEGKIMGKSITIQGNEYLFKGHVEIPADKSISHRAVILSSLNSTETIINNILFSEDISSTISCFFNWV